MDYTAHKVNETIFEGFLSGNKDSLTLNTLQDFFNETIVSFSEKWVLVLDDQHNCNDFSVPATHRLYGHKYYILMDYKTKSYYKIGIPNPTDRTSIESRQKSIIIYQGRSLLFESIDTVFQKYLKNDKSNYIVSDLKYILVHTFSSLFEQEKEDYFRVMETQLSSKKSKETFYEVDDVFLSYNIDEENIERYKESFFFKLKGILKILSVNRKDILFKDYSNQKIIRLINLSLGIFDLMKAINEYIKADASVYLEWDNWGRPFRFQNFNATLLKDFREEIVTEDTLRLVRESISKKIEELNEMGSQFRELPSHQSNISYSKLKRKMDSSNGFKSYEFRLKELLAKLQLKTKRVFSETVSQIGKFVNKGVQKCINLVRKTWFYIPLAYVILSILSAFFQAWFNGNIKLFDFFIKLSVFLLNFLIFFSEMVHK